MSGGKYGFSLILKRLVQVLDSLPPWDWALRTVGLRAWAFQPSFYGNQYQRENNHQQNQKYKAAHTH